MREHAASATQQSLLRLVVVGSVDDGKSSLIGRLLYECNGLYEDQVRAVERASKSGELDFSLFTDGLKAEREQGITIDVAYRYFSTTRRRVIVADTPGHLQYTRNMVTGASTADAAVVLVDARLGILPQTRRHAFLASLLGIPALAFAINKIDLRDGEPAALEAMGAEIRAFAARLGFEQVAVFPVSATRGDNITAPSRRTPWHDGGTLLEWLDAVPHQPREQHAPWRLPVQLVIRPNLDYRGFAGQVASGSVRVGDEVQVQSSGRRTRIASLDTFDGPLQEARAPQSVTVRLADEVDVARGDLLTPASSTAQSLTRLDAILVWMGDEPLRVGHSYLVKHTTRHVSAHVEAVLARQELEALVEVDATALAANDIGRVRLALKRPLWCDPYRENRTTGAFIVIDPSTNDTVGAGMILGAAPEAEASSVSLVDAAARAARLGHRALIALLPHTLPAADASRLEERLFALGVAAAVTDDAGTAEALARAGLVALLRSRGAQAERSHRDTLAALGPPLHWVDGSFDAQELATRAGLGTPPMGPRS